MQHFVIFPIVSITNSGLLQWDISPFFFADDPYKKLLISIQDEVIYEHNKYFLKIFTLIQMYRTTLTFLLIFIQTMLSHTSSFVLVFRFIPVPASCTFIFILLFQQNSTRIVSFVVFCTKIIIINHKRYLYLFPKMVIQTKQGRHLMSEEYYSKWIKFALNGRWRLFSRFCLMIK